MTAILEFDQVRLSFAGVKAIDGVSFSVGQHELFAIIGPNGAGKTSIFNVISGVYRPRSGRVEFDGRSLVGRRPHEIAALGIARTFQNVELFAHLTVLENLMLGRHHHIRYGPLAAIAWLGRARREERANRPRSRTSSTSWSSSSGAACRWGCCRTGYRNGWSWAARWPCSRSCSCSTSRWPA